MREKVRRPGGSEARGTLKMSPSWSGRRSSGGRVVLRWSFAVVLVLLVAAGSLPAAGVARSSNVGPMVVAAPESGQAPGVKMVWGRSVEYSPSPQPGKRTRTSVNAVILEKTGKYYREIVRPANVKVTCEVLYSRGWKNIVKRLLVPGGWRSDVDEYGGDGEVRCGPWTVLKNSLGLWQQLTPRVVYRGISLRGPTWRRQIHRSSDTEPADPPVPISFLPRVKSGSIYPKLADVPFSSPASALWRAFGKPPSSTCNTSGGLGCSWRTAVDELNVSDGGDSAQDGGAGGALRFASVVLSTKDLTRSKLRGWTTPDGIHLGSTAAEVKQRIADPLQCGARSCDIEPRLRLHLAGDARYRFFVQFLFDGRPSNPASRVTMINVRQLNREEGACLVHLLYNTPTAFQFEATCSGKLTAARLEPHNGSTRLASDPGEDPDGSWLLYEDNGSQAPQTAPRSVVRTRFTSGEQRWQIGCPERLAGPVEDPFYCPPGRNDRGGGLAWRDGVFEEWHLTFRGTSSVRANLNASPIKIAPLRFVAEFLDREPFVYIIRRG